MTARTQNLLRHQHKFAVHTWSRPHGRAWCARGARGARQQTTAPPRNAPSLHPWGHATPSNKPTNTPASHLLGWGVHTSDAKPMFCSVPSSNPMWQAKTTGHGQPACCVGPARRSADSSQPAYQRNSYQPIHPKSTMTNPTSKVHTSSTLGPLTTCRIACCQRH